MIRADSETAAVTQIKQRGLFPTTVTEGRGAKVAKKQKRIPANKAIGKKKNVANIEIKIPGLGARVKPKQLMVITRQLSTLINAGLPLLRSLQVLEKQEKNFALKKALSESGEVIQTGSTFAEALSQHPKIFSKLFINMVKAGEIGGVLDVVLARLAEFMEKAEKIKTKVKGAMVYPIVVLVMAFGILTFLMIKIVPKFREVFTDMVAGKTLPVITQLVFNTSEFIIHRFHVMIISLVTIVVIIKIIGKTSKGQLVMDILKLRLPLFGTLVRKTAVARFTRTLGTLMTPGVPVLQALTIVSETADNAVISKAVLTIHDSIKEGENMAPPLEATGVFQPIVVSMVEVGEETGELPEMLVRIADGYDEEVDAAVAGLTATIEPIMIVVLALIVGTIVIALFIPLISIIGSLS